MRDNSISNDGASSRPTAPSRNPGRARAEARLIGWIAAAGMLTGACVGLVRGMSVGASTGHLLFCLSEDRYPS
jgi:hypothetical protein